VVFLILQGFPPSSDPYFSTKDFETLPGVGISFLRAGIEKCPLPKDPEETRRSPHFPDYTATLYRNPLLSNLSTEKTSHRFSLNLFTTAFFVTFFCVLSTWF